MTVPTSTAAQASRKSASGVIGAAPRAAVAAAARSISPSRSWPRRRSRCSVRAIAPSSCLVVEAEQVQQAVQRQDPQLGAEGVAGRRGLAGGDAGGDDDVAERDRLAPGAECLARRAHGPAPATWQRPGTTARR